MDDKPQLEKPEPPFPCDPNSGGCGTPAVEMVIDEDKKTVDETALEA